MTACVHSCDTNLMGHVGKSAIASWQICQRDPLGSYRILYT